MSVYSIAESIETIVIGGSAGSLEQLPLVLQNLSPQNCPAILLAIHLKQTQGGTKMHEVLDSMLKLDCVEAKDGLPLTTGTLYCAHPNYHLVHDPDQRCCQLYDDEPLAYAKPSIDLLFNSFCNQHAKNTLAIVLSGANSDGSEGLRNLFDSGAHCVVADPTLSHFRTMPEAALARVPNATVLNPLNLKPCLKSE